MLSANYYAPISTYSRGASCDSVTGGYVYRRSVDAILDGGYLYTDFCDDRVSLPREDITQRIAILDRRRSV